MSDIILDYMSVYYMARGLRAKQEILDEGGSVEKGNVAFEKEFWMPYDPNSVISAIEEHPNLNAHLLTFLDAHIAVKELRRAGKKDELKQAVAVELAAFDQFEFLRRMTAFDCKALIFTL